MSLYELECEEGNHYHGKTTRDVDTRYREHQAGTGAAFTREYPPVRLVSSRPATSIHDEDNATKDGMMKYGVDKVYGGSYAQFPRPPEMTIMLHREIDTMKDACYTCHETGHYTRECPTSRPKTADKCRVCEQEHSVWDCQVLDARQKAQETAPEPSPSSGKADVEIQTDIPMEEVRFTVTFKRQPCAPVQAPVSRRTRSQTGPVMTRSQSRARGRAGI